ncbi:MAG: ankyrin repeat domain-containing protein [Candidatus Dependentiae bacterium]|nr:ankyrin repeat domain-containing protein [Candidatus Dependentiae bacterium]
MKKLLLALIILFSNIQIFCSNQKTQGSYFSILIQNANHAIEHGIDFTESELKKIVKGNGNKWLKQAIKNKNILEVHQLIALGADVNKKNGYDGNSSLHNAVIFNFYEAVLLLLTVGAKIDLRNKSGKTPLQIAIDSHEYDEDNEVDEDIIVALESLQFKNDETYLEKIIKIKHLHPSLFSEFINFHLTNYENNSLHDTCITNHHFDNPSHQPIESLKTVTQRNAATQIQALSRGFLARKSLKNEIES